MDARFTACFRHWLAQQEADLEELELALANPPSPTNDEHLRAAVLKTIVHFQEYSARRLSLAKEDPTAFLSPNWCSSFEKSFLWIGGCRPTLSTQLVYAHSGILDVPLNESGASTGGGIEGITLKQKVRIDHLRMELDLKEQEMDWNMAKVQKLLADDPMVAIATKKEGGSGEGTSSSNGGGGNVVRATMEGYVKALLETMEQADGLRIAAMRVVAMEILTLKQAAQYMVAAKKIHLKVHDWGMARDLERGRGEGGGGV